MKDAFLMELEEIPKVTSLVYLDGSLGGILDRIATECRAVEFDITTETGRKSCASLAYKIAQSKTHLEALGKEAVADWKKKTAEVDARRKSAVEFLDFLKAEIRKPLTDYEDRERLRCATHEEKIKVFDGVNCAGNPVEIILEKLAMIEDLFRKREWDEYRARASAAFSRAHALLTDGLAARRKYDADQIELAALRAREEAVKKQEAELKAREAALKLKSEIAQAEKDLKTEKPVGYFVVGKTYNVHEMPIGSVFYASDRSYRPRLTIIKRDNEYTHAIRNDGTREFFSIWEDGEEGGERARYLEVLEQLPEETSAEASEQERIISADRPLIQNDAMGDDEYRAWIGDNVGIPAPEHNTDGANSIMDAAEGEAPEVRKEYQRAMSQTVFGNAIIAVVNVSGCNPIQAWQIVKAVRAGEIPGVVFHIQEWQALGAIRRGEIQCQKIHLENSQG